MLNDRKAELETHQLFVFVNYIKSILLIDNYV